MTRDELLAKIDEEVKNNEFACSVMAGAPSWILSSLRGVIEWHKPSPIPDWVPTEDKLMCWCAHVYPCPTIQAIEKELE